MGPVYTILSATIGIGSGFDALKQLVCQFVITTNGNALVFVIKIIIIKGESYGQTFDNEGRQFSTFAATWCGRYSC